MNSKIGSLNSPTSQVIMEEWINTIYQRMTDEFSANPTQETFTFFSLGVKESTELIEGLKNRGVTQITFELPPKNNLNLRKTIPIVNYTITRNV